MSQLSMDASMQWAAMIQVSGVLLHEMSESRVETKDYSVMFFNRIAVNYSLSSS